MVTQEQATFAEKLGIHLDRMPQKLISSNDPRTVVLYIDNLLYSLVHYSAEVICVSEIIQFKQDFIMRSYIQKLQQQRASAPSGLLNKAIKSLG